MTDPPHVNCRGSNLHFHHITIHYSEYEVKSNYWFQNRTIKDYK